MTSLESGKGGPRMPERASPTKCAATAASVFLALSALGAQEVAGPLPRLDWTGLAKPSRSAVMGFERDGVVRAVPVVEGQRIAEGEVLMRIDASVIEAEVARLEILAGSDSRLRDAELRLALAAREAERLEELNSHEIVSPAKLERARLDRDVAEVAVAAARVQQAVHKAELVEAQRRLALYTLRSPFDGIVAKLEHRTGNAVERLTPVLHLVDTDPIWVEFDCGLAEIAELPTGAHVEVEQLAGGPRRIGTVVHRSVLAEAASQTRKVRVAVPNPKGDWIPGSKMRVRLSASIPARPK